MTDHDPALIEKAAKAFHQEFCCSAGPVRESDYALVHAVFDAVYDDIRAAAWDVGYKTGYSYRGPWGAPGGQPVPENPYREEADRG